MKPVNVVIIIILAHILCFGVGCNKNTDKKLQPSNSPAVTTKPVTNISSSSFVSGGTISNATNITDKGIIWATDSNMLTVTSSNKVSNGAGQADFTDTIQNLQSNTNYYLKAYAVYNGGISYGAVIGFITHPDVYIAGIDGTSAVYWKNDSLFTLSKYNSEAHSIYVAGNDVYVAGADHSANGKSVAAYWKNGIEVPLTDGTTLEVATSIFVKGNDVYVAGVDNNGYLPIAKYWKNGVAVSLTKGTADNYGQANSIYVDNGGYLYVAGYIGNTIANTLGPIYWQNGFAISLSDSNKIVGETQSIYVDGHDIYIAGFQVDKTSGASLTTFWQNGIAEILPDGYRGGSGNSIYVYNGDVYVAGYQGPGYYFAAYWKNGTEFFLTNGVYEAVATSICASRNDVYIVGYEGTAATYTERRYWKNGISIPLKTNTNYCTATSVFIR